MQENHTFTLVEFSTNPDNSRCANRLDQWFRIRVPYFGDSTTFDGLQPEELVPNFRSNFPSVV